MRKKSSAYFRNVLNSWGVVEEIDGTADIADSGLQQIRERVCSLETIRDGHEDIGGDRRIDIREGHASEKEREEDVCVGIEEGAVSVSGELNDGIDGHSREKRTRRERERRIGVLRRSG